VRSITDGQAAKSLLKNLVLKSYCPSLDFCILTIQAINIDQATKVMGKNSKNKEKTLSAKSVHKIIRANMSELMNLDFGNQYKEQKEDSLERLKSICDKRSDKEKINYVTFLEVCSEQTFLDREYTSTILLGSHCQCVSKSP